MLPSAPSRYPMSVGFRTGHDARERGQSNEMGVSVLIMEPILRFLQLLCENHNRDLQVGIMQGKCVPFRPVCWLLLNVSHLLDAS